MDPPDAAAPSVAQFRFYEELNDFLAPALRKCEFPYAFTGTPSVKDAIEAIGVPHTEVDLVLVDGESVDFTRRLTGSERVAVYPVFERLDIAPVTRLRARPLRRTRFVLDVHLGKLARYLRLLGFDALYRTDYDDATIIRLSLDEQRIILTRDRGVLKHAAVTHGYWVRSTVPRQQLGEVVRVFDLGSNSRPFTRCRMADIVAKEFRGEGLAAAISETLNRIHLERSESSKSTPVIEVNEVAAVSR